MKNMIDLQVQDGYIVAIYTGPHAERIVLLFGTPILPTAFEAEYGIERAAEIIRRHNPDCVVYSQVADQEEAKGHLYEH